jgi:hypothetical protein
MRNTMRLAVVLRLVLRLGLRLVPATGSGQAESCGEFSG